MDNSDFLFILWNKEQKVFRKNLALIKKKPGKKAVHDLRVAIKKLRAALELHFLITEKPPGAISLKDTKQLFKILGKQRDIEICLELIAAFEKENGKKYASLKQYCRSVLSVTQKWSRNTVRQYKSKELEEAAIFLKEESLAYEQEELRIKIEGIINKYLTNCRSYYKDPHKIRQQLKQIYYWIKMTPDPLFPKVGYEKELNQLLDELGNWQDLYLFEIKLKRFRKEYQSKSFTDYESIKLLEAEVKEKKDSLLKLSLQKTSILMRKVTLIQKEKPRL